MNKQAEIGAKIKLSNCYCGLELSYTCKKKEPEKKVRLNIYCPSCGKSFCFTGYHYTDISEIQSEINEYYKFNFTKK